MLFAAIALSVTVSASNIDSAIKLFEEMDGWQASQAYQHYKVLTSTRESAREEVTVTVLKGDETPFLARSTTLLGDDKKVEYYFYFSRSNLVAYFPITERTCMMADANVISRAAHRLPGVKEKGKLDLSKMISDCVLSTNSAGDRRMMITWVPGIFTPLTSVDQKMPRNAYSEMTIRNDGALLQKITKVGSQTTLAEVQYLNSAQEDIIRFRQVEFAPFKKAESISDLAFSDALKEAAEVTKGVKNQK